MRKLVTWGVIGVAMLAAPSAANATHVAGATYNGTVSTGQGGTVQIIVAPDGDTLSFQASGLGNVSGTCTGVGFGPITNVPIENHAFSISENSGQLTANGFFGEPASAAGGAQVLGIPCTTGSQAWSATTPAPGVDALIAGAAPNSQIGDGIFNTSAEGQTRRQGAKRGQTKSFPLEFQNDGNVDGNIAVDGCGDSRGFKVNYFAGGDKVTAAVRSGAFHTGTLPTGGSFEMTMRIKALRTARVGRTKACKVRGESSNVDVVKGEVKVRRG